MPDRDPVDAATYAAHLDRLDRIGREALAADPATAIGLVREANDLVAELLPMHRRLMDELATHRATLQAACEELAADRSTLAADDASPADAPPHGDDEQSQLDRLADLEDGDAAPF
jgi:hypothetical protein